MRIKLFTVHGYTNFSDPLTFGPLDDVNAIYGPNNCGKSNLLRALDLYFLLMGAGEGVSRSQTHILDNPDERLQHAIQQGLTRGAPQPITFDVEWTVRRQDLEKYGLFAEAPCAHVRTVLELKALNRTYEIRVKSWMHEDTDVAALDRSRDAATVVFAQQVRRLLADARPFKFDRPVHPMAFLGKGTEPFPQSLRDALFDARQSIDADQRRRWALFADLASCVQSELGEGTWQTLFDRPSGRADVVYIQGEEPISLEMMGSGLQRLTGLLGELALAQEPWICVEEPEWRLSPELQKRFVTLVRRVLFADLGPTQVFTTTHSPALAARATGFAMEPSGLGPTLERKAWEAVGEGGETLSEPDPEAALSSLIGLVDELAEMEEDQIMAQVQSIGSTGANDGDRPQPVASPR